VRQPAPGTQMRVPNGIERGAAMVVPSRTWTPEAVMPSPRRVQIGEQWQYAVTVKRRSLGACAPG
jgi:hypothetical protein